MYCLFRWRGWDQAMSDEERGLKKNDSHDTEETSLAVGLENEDTALGVSHNESAQPNDEAEELHSFPDHAQELLTVLREAGVEDNDLGIHGLMEMFHDQNLSMEGESNARLKSTGLDVDSWAESYLQQLRDFFQRNPGPSKLRDLDKEGRLLQLLRRGLDSDHPVAPNIGASTSGAMKKKLPKRTRKKRGIGTYKKDKIEFIDSKCSTGTELTHGHKEGSSVLVFKGDKEKAFQDQEKTSKDTKFTVKHTVGDEEEEFEQYTLIAGPYEWTQNLENEEESESGGDAAAPREAKRSRKDSEDCPSEGGEKKE